MKTPEYNQTTEILLEWGRLFLQKNSDTDTEDALKEIETVFLRTDDLSATGVSEDIDQIASGMKEAVDTLQDSDIIGATPDDEYWYNATDAFELLDAGVYLMEAAEWLIRRKNEQLADRILSRVETIYKDVTDTLFSAGFSPLRLATYNEWRRDAIADIPEDRHFLFPWYDQMNDEPSGILTVLADHVHHLDKSELLPEELTRQLRLYMAEIQRDQVLRRHICEENVIARAIRSELDTHWSIRLRHAARMEGYKHLLPEDIEMRGIENVSRAVFNEKKLSPAERFAIAVAGACFAPGMVEKERTDILLECEEILAAGDYKTKGQPAESNCIEGLLLMAKGEISGSDAAVRVLDLWFSRLEMAGSAYGVKEKTMTALIREFLVPMESETPQVTGESFAHQVMMWLAEWFFPRAVWAKGYMRDEGENSFELEGFRLIQARRKDDRVVLMEKEALENDSDREEFMAVYAVHERDDLYQAIVVQDEKGIWRKTDLVPEIGKEQFTLTEAPGDFFIWVMNTRKKRQKESLEILLENLNSGEAPDRKIKKTAVVRAVQVL